MHEYWILLTIVVVLRGSLAQTLERRNSRIAGTLLGCVLAGAVLASHAPALVLLMCITVAQGVAQAFAIRRYVVTAVAATVLALLQAHLLNAGG
ncbi:FUSC family protein, partial [Roseateles sp. GG27B]